MSSGGFHRFGGNLGRSFRERGKNAAGVEPAAAISAEDLLPVDLSWLQLRNSGMPTVGAANRRAQSEPALGKVEAIANLAPNSVVFNPLQVRLVHASLIDQILHQPADGVIGERRDHSGIQPEAALQPAGNVVFAATLPRAKLTRVRNPVFPGIEAQHDFAQSHKVPPAFCFFPKLKSPHNPPFIRSTSSIVYLSLIGKPQADLKPARRLRRGDLPEGSGSHSRIRSIQAGHVEHIGRLSAQLKVDSLAESEGAENGKIHIFIARLIEKIARRVAVYRSAIGRGVLGKGGCIEPAQRRAYM